MAWLVVVLIPVLFWGALLLALARGVFIIPLRGVLDIVKRSVRLTLLAGLLVCFPLALGAGHFAGRLPSTARWRAAATVSLMSMPYYAMVITVGVVQQDKRWERARGGPVRLLSQLAILCICTGAALIVTLAVLASVGAPFTFLPP